MARVIESGMKRRRNRSALCDMLDCGPKRKRLEIPLSKLKVMPYARARSLAERGQISWEDLERAHPIAGNPKGTKMKRKRRKNVVPAAWPYGVSRNKRPKKFIKKAVKRPGALTATLRKWRILGKTKKVGDLSRKQLNRAYARAKKLSKSRQAARRKMGTRTMRQINFYRRVLKPISRRRKAAGKRKRKAKIVRLPKVTRRIAANANRKRRGKRTRRR